MILPAQQIAFRGDLVSPFEPRTVHNGMSYGLSACGYDVRIAESMDLNPGEFRLGSTIEYFNTPKDLVAMVYDKSTWARRGLSLFNTVIEPGWRGWLTLELTNHSTQILRIRAGDPIAQIIWTQLSDFTVMPYEGKYQNQGMGAQPAINELKP